MSASSGSTLATGTLIALVATAACGVVGLAGDGVCQSTPVEFSFGLVVYCQNDFSEDECSSYDNQGVNGAEWAFHSGQTCQERDLEEGSNDWP